MAGAEADAREGGSKAKPGPGDSKGCRGKEIGRMNLLKKEEISRTETWSVAEMGADSKLLHLRLN
jgi:hypothetical protein